jgi:hypothetical protein
MSQTNNKKELHQVNGTGFSDPTVFYDLWAYFKKEVKGVTLKQERITNTKLKKDVKSVLMESSTQLGKKRKRNLPTRITIFVPLNKKA